MSDLLYLISEEGIAVFLLLVVLLGVGYFGRWFITNYTARVDTKYAELMREIGEIKTEVLANNEKLYSMTSTLVGNQRAIGEDVNAIESSLDTLLKYIKANGSK